MLPVDQSAMKPEVIEKISGSGVVAVLVIDKVKHAVPLANALIEGGVHAIELTLRTPVAVEAAKEIKRKFQDIILGIGTVLTVDQITVIADLGADFAVAPGCNPRIIEAAMNQNLSYAPGIATASELELAVEMGCRILKFFPAEQMGGMHYLKNMAAPYKFLGVKFIPLGGLNMANAKEYLDSDIILSIGGSWIAPREIILDEDWKTITANAKEIRRLISTIRGL